MAAINLTRLGAELDFMLSLYTRQFETKLLGLEEYKERCALLLNTTLVALGTRSACLFKLKPHDEFTQLCKSDTAYGRLVWSRLQRTTIGGTTLFRLPSSEEAKASTTTTSGGSDDRDLGKLLGYPTPFTPSSLGDEVIKKDTPRTLTRLYYVLEGRQPYFLYGYTTLPYHEWDMNKLHAYNTKIAAQYQNAFTSLGLKGRIGVEYAVTL